MLFFPLWIKSYQPLLYFRMWLQRSVKPQSGSVGALQDMLLSWTVLCSGLCLPPSQMSHLHSKLCPSLLLLYFSLHVYNTANPTTICTLRQGWVSCSISWFHFTWQSKILISRWSVLAEGHLYNNSQLWCWKYHWTFDLRYYVPGSVQKLCANSCVFHRPTYYTCFPHNREC